MQRVIKHRILAVGDFELARQTVKIRTTPPNGIGIVDFAERRAEWARDVLPMINEAASEEDLQQILVNVNANFELTLVSPEQFDTFMAAGAILLISNNAIGCHITEIVFPRGQVNYAEREIVRKLSEPFSKRILKVKQYLMPVS